MFSGRQKLAFAQRLGDDWQDLADYFEVPVTQRQSFPTGREPQAVWEWLEARHRLPQLPEALRYIGREDIVVDVLEPPPAASACLPTWQGSPFPGLRAFTAAEAPIFFGRAPEATELLTRLQHERFVAVIGASGSGKSSLAAAGVLPRLHEIPGGQEWQSIRFTPADTSDDPFVALTAKLAPGMERYGLNSREMAQRLRQTGDLETLLEQYLQGRPASTELLLFIDQFEELFTLTSPTHHDRFIAMLARAAQLPRLRILLTVRADFYHHCVAAAPLARLLRTGSFPLTAPELPALLEMITGPARAAGVTFEDSLPGRLLRDTGREPGSLALLAFALAELYTACQQSRLLTHAAYDSFGGVQGAIAQRAETAYGELEDAAQEALGAVFKELVEVEPERGIPTRKRAALARYATTPAAQRLLKRFTEARLLVCDDIGHGEVVVEVAHEALLTSWQRLDAWITERFDDLRLLRHVRLEAAEWQWRGCLDSHLWRHERLQPVYAMCQRLQPTLSTIEQEFVKPEAERLLEEIDNPTISHQRRAITGDRLAEIGDPRSGVGLDRNGLPDFVWVPVAGGEITLEKDARTFAVQPFAISKYPVTWAQYHSFLQAEDGYRNAQWWQCLEERQDEPGEQYRQQHNYPAENVSWYDAVAFCRWLSVHLGYEVRLPTEWEWQQAATGGNPANEFPWGANRHSDRANTLESGLSRTIAVGLYPHGASPGGILDMSGNVWEWCLNEYEKPLQVGLSGSARRAVRGGAWYDGHIFARATFRGVYAPGLRDGNVGLRVARTSPIRS